MSFTVFYSWQDDRPGKHHHYLIRDALTDAIGRIPESEGLAVEEAPRLDHDTKGVSGTPEIAATLFGKIDHCALFVADLTFVGMTNPLGNTVSEPLPNPNVLVELGYAACRIGWNRIVCVMNTFYGSADEQIFDIKHRRWPIRYEATYEMAEDSSELRLVQAKLAGDLLVALRSALANEHEEVNRIVRLLDISCLKLIGKYGNAQWFSAPTDFALGVPVNEIDTPSFHRAVERLLDLEVLKADVAPSKGLYAYHWTYLGTLVCKKLRNE